MAIAAIKSYQKRDYISPNIGQWMQQAESLYKRVKESGKDFFGNDKYDVYSQQGLAQHGFVLAIYCLLCTQDKPVDQLFDFAMRQCVKLQGDTDTNATTVGGLIGSYVGLDNIKIKK